MIERYTVDAVAMNYYIGDRLPAAAEEIFERAEQGIDAVEAPPVTVTEVMASFTGTDPAVVAGVELDTSPRTVLRGVVLEGPVDVAPVDEHDLAVLGSLLDHHTLHDAMVIASHRVRGTEAIVTNDGSFAGEETVWD